MTTELSLKLTNHLKVRKLAKKVGIGKLSHDQMEKVIQKIKEEQMMKKPSKDIVIPETKEVALRPLPTMLPDGELEKDFRNHFHKGSRTLIATLAVVTIFAGFYPISGAVIVGGTFVVQQVSKKVQHKTGGTVDEILIKDGSKVRAGEVLIRLDSTEPQAQVDTLARQIDELEIRISRLTAERDDTKMVLPTNFLSSPEVYEAIKKAEVNFFNKRKITQENIQKIAKTKITQLEKQIKASEIQLRTNKKQGEINERELAGAEQLFAKQYTSVQRLSPLQREKERVAGVEKTTQVSIEETITKIKETELQAQQSLETFRADVMKELNDTNAKSSQLREQYVVAKQALTRMEVLAPVAGIVQELSVHTKGGVISPAETLMTIVPENALLDISSRLSPDKIDQVRVGQPARVKLTAFQRTTPDINGTVSFVSPDLIEAKTGPYYEIRVSVEQSPMGLTLSPGMPAEVFLETDKRTFLSYLIKPIAEQFPRMFVER